MVVQRRRANVQVLLFLGFFHLLEGVWRLLFAFTPLFHFHEANPKEAEDGEDWQYHVLKNLHGVVKGVAANVKQEKLE